VVEEDLGFLDVRRGRCIIIALSKGIFGWDEKGARKIRIDACACNAMVKIRRMMVDTQCKKHLLFNSLGYMQVLLFWKSMGGEGGGRERRIQRRVRGCVQDLLAACFVYSKLRL